MPRTNSSKGKFEEGLLKFKQGLKARGYPENIIERSLSEVNVASRQSALSRTQKPKGHECLLPFVTTYHPSVKNLKQILMEHWTLIHNQPLLKTIFTKPPIICYKTGKSLKDMLVRDRFVIDMCQSIKFWSENWLFDATDAKNWKLQNFSQFLASEKLTNI